MQKKRFEKVKKITHLELHPKKNMKRKRYNKNSFDFENPLNEDVIKAPRIQEREQFDKDNLDEFFQFKSTHGNSVAEEKQIVLSKNQINKENIKTVQKKERFSELFRKSGLYDSIGSTHRAKSWFFGIISLLFFGSSMILTRLFGLQYWYVVLPLGLLFSLFSALFFLLSVQKKQHYYYFLLFLTIVTCTLFGTQNWSIMTFGILFIAIILLFSASKSIERHQILYRLFDVHAITQKGQKLLALSFIFSYIIALTSFGSLGSPAHITNTLLNNQFINDSIEGSGNVSIADAIQTLYGIIPFTQIQTTNAQYTVEQFIRQFHFDQKQVLDQNEINKINRNTALQSPEERSNAIRTREVEELEGIRLKYYSTIAPSLSTLLQKKTYREMSRTFIANKMTVTTVDFGSILPKYVFGESSVTLWAISSLVLIMIVIAFALYFFIISFLKIVTNITPEDSIFWILKKLKIVTVNNEQLECELVTI